MNNLKKMMYLARNDPDRRLVVADYVRRCGRHTEASLIDGTYRGHNEFSMELPNEFGLCRQIVPHTCRHPDPDITFLTFAGRLSVYLERGIGHMLVIDPNDMGHLARCLARSVCAYWPIRQVEIEFNFDANIEDFGAWCAFDDTGLPRQVRRHLRVSRSEAAENRRVYSSTEAPIIDVQESLWYWIHGCYPADSSECYLARRLTFT